MLNQSRVRHPKRWFWVTTSVIGAFVILTVMFVAAVPLSSDAMRHRIIKSLSQRMNSDVELGDLHLRVFPRMRAEGEGLTIRQHGAIGVPPLISVKSFTVDADLLGLIRKHVARVELVGLDIQIPPKDHDDDHDAPPKPASGRATATTGVKGETSAHRLHDPATTAPVEADNKPHTDPVSIEDGVVIDTLVSNDAQLVIIPRKKHKEPKVWAIHALTMHNVGANESMPFEAQLTNGVPPGEIDASGNFGPWVVDSPGSTPLNGDFTFDNADLGVFKGISGILASKGSFGGSLEWIDVNGETDVPNFMIKVGGHPFPLHAKYHSVVDGTNGDTRLEMIDATFLQSHLLASGAVLDGPPGEKGRTVTLDIKMDRARIEDIMVMAVHTAKPPMSGALQLTSKFLLPPGENDVSERLRLDGRFTMTSARFTNVDVQGKIDELSHRGSGKDPMAAKDKVISRFDGRFKLANGSLILPELSFDVPGAKVELAGNYTLKPETLAFRGVMSMDAKISETQKGFKRLVLKVVDPLFRKDGGGSAIPFKVEGTRSDPKFGLDVRRVFRKGDNKS